MSSSRETVSGWGDEREDDREDKREYEREGEEEEDREGEVEEEELPSGRGSVFCQRRSVTRCCIYIYIYIY